MNDLTTGKDNQMAAEPDWQELTNQLDELSVELWYPLQRKAKAVRVSLYDVRAADDLLIRFDHDRDGWVIAMDLSHDDHSGIIKVVEAEQEVAFIPAWNELRDTPS